MIKVLSSGLPVSANNILKDAAQEVFGEVDLRELSKDNLRSMVRLSSRSVEVALVVLDRVSEDICRDIERGLYNSSKYYCYSSDYELVKFLNTTYGLDIPYPEKEEEVQVLHNENNVNVDAIVGLYEEKLSVKDDTIRNLECRIKDLYDFYGDISESQKREDVEALKEENISLSGEILDLKSSLEKQLEEIESLSSNLEKANKEKDDALVMYSGLNEKYDSVVAEVRDLKVSNSQLSGVLRSKDKKIESLESGIRDLKSVEKELVSQKEKVKGLNSKLSEKDADMEGLNSDIQRLKKDIVGYLAEIESLRKFSENEEKLEEANRTIKSLREEISGYESELRTIKRSVSDKDGVIGQLSESLEDQKGKVEELETQIENLKKRVEDDDESISKLNADKIDLQSKLDSMSMTRQSVDNTGYLEEIDSLNEKIRYLQSNAFSRIGSSAMPNGSVKCSVLSGKGRFRNIKFAFAGSAESRKGSYKCILEEIRKGYPENRYLIVDLVSETFVDYVFEIRKVIPGIEWLRCGGSVQRFVSSTSLKNVQVLSMGLGFVNDSYFLAVDWAKRLMELDNSGYSVIVFCGDISNLIGRVLFDSFADFGETTVYVQGSATCSRSIITNLRGLSNASKSSISYYDFNEISAGKFYNIVSKSYQTRILSRK